VRQRRARASGVPSVAFSSPSAPSASFRSHIGHHAKQGAGAEPRRRLAPFASGARSRPAQATQKSAMVTPASHGLPVRDGDKEPGRVALAAAVLRDHPLQELAVRSVTLQITLVHLRCWWRQRLRKGRLGLWAPVSTGALPVSARHERSRARRCTSRHRACPPLQRKQSGQARNPRALGRDRCAQRRVAPVSAHFSTRAPSRTLDRRSRSPNESGPADGSVNP
jgi:hypothetical protein